MTRAPDPPAVGGVPASIAAIMAAIRAEVTAPPRAAAVAEPEARVHPIPGVATTDGRLEEVPAGMHPIPGVVTTDGRLEEVPAGMHAIPGVATAVPAATDAIVREMLAPLLKAWLDAHLPEIVEAAVHAEIRRRTQ